MRADEKDLYDRANAYLLADHASKYSKHKIFFPFLLTVNS